MSRALVAIPARDEADSIGACLGAVALAARAARAGGRIRSAHVAVVAHRCADGTAQLARDALADAGLDGWLVVEDEVSPSVGAARSTAVRAALGRWPGLDPRATWLFSTDADSTPPADWMIGLLEEVEGHPDAPAAARGLVALEGWAASPEAQRRYDAIIAAGTHGDDHDHVYGANLLVRLDAYLAAGGFPDVASGEDHALVAALRRLGHRVPGVFRPVVPTAGRTRARARDGLGALLARLGAEAAECGTDAMPDAAGAAPVQPARA